MNKYAVMLSGTVVVYALANIEAKTEAEAAVLGLAAATNLPPGKWNAIWGQGEPKDIEIDDVQLVEKVE